MVRDDMITSIRMKKRFIYSSKLCMFYSGITYPMLGFAEEVIREELEFPPKEDMDRRVACTEQKSEDH